jgi:glycosyltransferase involved in cell wall biosynthesis
MIKPAGDRRPRLLVLASTYPRWLGDPEPGFVHELSRRLTDKFDVTVLGPHAAGAATEEMFDGVRVVRYRYAPMRLETLVNDGGIVTNLKRHRWKWLLVPGFLLMQAWSTWRLIRQFRPDVVHAHWLLPQGLIVALIGLIEPLTPPMVVTSHGADLFALRARPLQVLKRFVARRAAALAVVSATMRDELTRMGIDLGKVHVEPMGVDLNGRFSPDPTIERSRDEILFVGRLVEKKGLRHLIEAMPAILRVHPTARLTIVGFGPEEQACREQVRQFGFVDRMTFLGAVPQDDLAPLYRRAAVFVAPFVRTRGGDQEGLGLVLIEAAGCGCPIVAGNLPAVRDVVKDETIGLLVQSDDIEELAGAVCAVLEVPVTDHAVAKRVHAVQHFDWRMRAKAYAALLGAQVAK